MEISRVSIIGLGALGILFGYQLSKQMPKQNLRIVADQNRIHKYTSHGVYCNGELCEFNYMTPEQPCEPADLIIFAVKENGLDDAIEAMKKHVGENTIILSALNGISSEEIIGRTFGHDKVLYSVAQGMDAVKVGNQLTYENKGMLCFGEREAGVDSEKMQRVANFFDQVDFPYEVDVNMMKRQWGKFMLNVGVNQTVAVYETNYGGVQRQGKARDTMVAAMKEVIALSKKEGVDLSEDDLTYWLQILATLSPEGKPSMRQDLEAKRYSEVELFSGTVLELSRKHGIQTPVNRYLYDSIKRIESQY
ncbi:ketopantoate reductase family protein [Aquibacillus sediminis]|uniref:ketopantoate reductase family protein n=1 Tax=Aquibacillus sediminis TaxID=2574734 RepID=UPI001486DA7D|nr:ketopantoate reductase family protein [Aquibacillus sediminis]